MKMFADDTKLWCKIKTETFFTVLHTQLPTF